ncbi:MAG TPA: hypothetical protein VL947_10490 [Cytophagales bacterium]|nr:hypothetical protein [Cytophagales bacterium]
MGVTRLKRKERRNKTVSRLRNQALKLVTAAPVIKAIDLEELRKATEAQA